LALGTSKPIEQLNDRQIGAHDSVGDAKCGVAGAMYPLGKRIPQISQATFASAPSWSDVICHSLNRKA